MKTIMFRRVGLVVLVAALLTVMGGCPLLDTIVIFPDPALDAAVRAQLGFTGIGFLTKGDVLTLTTLDAQGDTQIGGDSFGRITSLQGIEACENLQILKLQYNNISDLTPLTDLTNLVELYLHENPIQSIFPLNALVNLDILTLWGNDIQIYDYSHLLALAQAQTLIEGADINFKVWVSGEDVYNSGGCDCDSEESADATGCPPTFRADFEPIYNSIWGANLQGEVYIYCLGDGEINV